MKSKLSNSLISVFLISTLFLCSFSNYTETSDKIDVADVTSDWTLCSSESDVNIYAKKVECIDKENGVSQELILLKVENSGNSTVNVTFNISTWYDGVLSENSDNENERSFLLGSVDSLEGNCGIYSDHSLTIFSRFLDKDNIPELSHFSVENLKVAVE